jgi:DNA-binding Xre family transcriptional regulator
MAVSYDKLWKLLVDKKMSRAELRKATDISSNTLTRMIKDEPVTLELLSRICDKLDCDFGDIVTYVPDIKNIDSVEEC